MTQRQIQHEMNRWLAEEVAGVSALLGVCHQVTEGMIVAALQEQQVKHHHIELQTALGSNQVWP